MTAGKIKPKKTASSKEDIPVLLEQIRTWRNDSFAQRMYDTALFWAEQLLAISDDEPMDTYYIAQIHFQNNKFVQCSEILTRRKLSEKSLWARLLAAECFIKLERWDDALETLGESDRFQSQKALDVRLNNTHGRAIKIESSLFYLRGTAYLNQGFRDKAKFNFIEALKSDLHCYQALQALLDNYMLSSGEEIDLMDKISFEGIPKHEGDYIKSLYMAKLIKFNESKRIEKVHDILKSKYLYKSSALIAAGKAEQLIIRRNFNAAFETLSDILIDHPYNFECLTLYIVCLSALEKKVLLFTLALKLVDLFPKDALPWFAVGAYYMTIGEYNEARRYFGKATGIDPGFGHAWIGFGHSFSLEGEFESALSIYSSACKVLPGSHLPKMYLGMQYSRLKNWKLAEEFLLVAEGICKNDPLLHNELGTVYYQLDNYEDAIRSFLKVIELVEPSDTPISCWAGTICNLGHAYRKLGKFTEAKAYFDTVAEDLESKESALCGLTLIAVNEKNNFKAIEYIHEVLAKNPDNPYCLSLLEELLSDTLTKEDAVIFPEFKIDYLEPEELNNQLREKLKRTSHDLEVPDLEFDISNELASLTSRKPPKNPLTLAKGKRISLAADSSPGLFASTKKGLLNFNDSSPNQNSGSRTPPRRKKASIPRGDRDSSPDEFPLHSTHMVDSDVFLDDPMEDDDMDLDGQSD